MNLVRLMCLLALALMPLTVQAQSFDCRTARHPEEYAICDNDDLAELDIEMSNLYFRLLNSLAGSARARLRSDQVEWLRERRDCGRSVRCIRTIYLQRIRELESHRSFNRLITNPAKVGKIAGPKLGRFRGPLTTARRPAAQLGLAR